MKKVVLGVVSALAVLLLFRYCERSKAEKAELEESSELIQQQISHVAKLVVTEGQFAEVFNYKDSRQLFGPLISARKKALVVVNAEVTVAYDLRKIEYEIDREGRTLRIQKLPAPEIRINPDFEYYDVQADYLNPFDAEDYNTIKDRVNASLMKKIRNSAVMENAENRLLSELSGLVLLTNTLEWTLTYEDRTIDGIREFQLPD